MKTINSDNTQQQSKETQPRFHIILGKIYLDFLRNLSIPIILIAFSFYLSGFSERPTLKLPNTQISTLIFASYAALIAAIFALIVNLLIYLYSIENSDLDKNVKSKKSKIFSYLLFVLVAFCTVIGMVGSISYAMYLSGHFFG